MDLSTVFAGIVAYAVAILASVVLVFLTFRLNLIVTNKLDEEQYLLSGNRSVAIALGAVLLSQALLMRHAIFPTMAVLRNLFIQPADAASTIWVLAHCVLFFLIIGILSFGSVAVACWLFTRMTRTIPERDEIRKDNIAIAIFFAFAILAISLILNEGLEDLSRSIIPFERKGVIQLR
jgi:uncharacterized membrane protein YjfL (UPF0719 family)